MITYTEIKRYPAMDNKEYRSLSQGRRSFSFLKSEIGGTSPHFEPTKAMELGSAVHDILSNQITQKQVDSEIFHQAREFAIHIKGEYFKDTWRLLDFETSYTATMNYAGLSMPVMGRTDCELPGHATIDFKITSATSDKQFLALCEFMRYPDQIWNYGNLAKTPKRYLLPYSTKRRCCLGLVSLPASPVNEFWQDAILKFATV